MLTISHSEIKGQISNLPIIFWIIKLTLIHKNIRSVHNSHAQELIMILNIIGQCDVKHILSSPIKSITPVLKMSTYIIAYISARPVGLAPILAINVCLDLQTSVILYIYRSVRRQTRDIEKNKTIKSVLKVSTNIFTSTCLDLQMCCYSIYIFKVNYMSYVVLQ